MGIRRKLKREMEKKILKHRRTEILELLNISKSKFFSLAPRTSGTGLDYGDVEFRTARGYVDAKDDTGKIKRRVGYHKPSLKSQYSLLMDMHIQKLEEDADLAKIKEELDRKKEEQEKSL